MRKTLLALVIGAGVLAAPAFAQVSLGGAGQAGAHAGGALPVGNAMHDTLRTAHQVGARAGESTRQIGRRTGHTSRHAVDQAAMSVRRGSKVDAHADANANANASADAGAAGMNGEADANVDAGGGLNTAATAGRAGEAGQGVGGAVRDSAHAAIQSADRSSGSVGDAVRTAATDHPASTDHSADAHATASGNAHGH